MSGTISNVVIPNGVATENNKNSHVLLVNFGMASLTSMQVEDTNTQTDTHIHPQYLQSGLQKQRPMEYEKRIEHGSTVRFLLISWPRPE